MQNSDTGYRYCSFRISRFILNLFVCVFLLPGVVLATPATPSAQLAATPEAELVLRDPATIPSPAGLREFVATASQDLGSGSVAEPSAVVIAQPRVGILSKKAYGATEIIELMVYDVRPDNIDVIVTKRTDEQVGVRIDKTALETESSANTRIMVYPPSVMEAAQYTLSVYSGKDILTHIPVKWGTLSLNSDRSRYAPDDTAYLRIEALGSDGAIACGEQLTLVAKAPSGKDTLLSTDDGTIVQSPDCTYHRATPEPNYQAHVVLRETGTYYVTLMRGDNPEESTTITLMVGSESPVSITRSAPSRISLSKDYEVRIHVTAVEDYEGTLTDAVPKNMTPSRVAGLMFPDAIATNDAGLRARNTLGAMTSILSLPFEGEWPMTLDFGEEEPDTSIRERIKALGITRHDGVDFGMPEGTSILAADNGTVDTIVENDTSYGLTIILKHSWGKTYYGHLSDASVKEGDIVTKGTVIAHSGNTGISSGPHLHFGVAPVELDRTNGYGGKIDPFAMLPRMSSSSYPTHLLRWNLSLKKGESVELGYRFQVSKQAPRFYFLGPIGLSDKGDSQLTDSHYWEMPVDPVSIELVGQGRPDFSREKLIKTVSSAGYTILKTQNRMTAAYSLWVLDRNYGEQWTRLTTESTIAASSPVTLKNATVFWISEDKKAIQGYDIPSKTFFGQTLDASAEYGDRTPFGNGEWLARYDETGFHFERSTDGITDEGDDSPPENRMFAEDYFPEIGNSGFIAGVATNSANVNK